MAISCAPVLIYLKVHSVPVLKNHHFRHSLTIFDRGSISVFREYKKSPLKSGLFYSCDDCLIKQSTDRFLPSLPEMLPDPCLSADV
ncbi:hypothetical protein F7P81_16320 [Pseudochrobactrum saccharolyticum]|nr:hypothetical protein F7P81_16320 [Pseudochrobactrum saccharolyticum]